MLRTVKSLYGDTLQALDGEIGSVDEVLFDDQTWTARYLVVNTGGWLNSRKVLIAPASLGVLDWERRLLSVNLTRSQVAGSPDVETDEPVSRQWETDYHNYYGWPYYWGGSGAMGAAWYAGAGLAPVEAAPAQVPGDSHLRGTLEVAGYGITARDGHLGHVADFLIDDETWRIRYLAVDTRDWWPGKKVLLPLDWLGLVSWPERTVSAAVTREQVRGGPEWDPREPISRGFEEELSGYYSRQRFGGLERSTRGAEALAGR